MGQSKHTFPEFSGALQQKTTTYIRKVNEVRAVKNVDFWTQLGSMKRRPGSQSSSVSMPKMPVNAPVLGAFIARFSSGVEIWACQNNAAVSPTFANLAYWVGPGATTWTNISTTIVKGSVVNFLDDCDEVWVSAYDPLLDAIGDPFTVDNAHSVSTTRLLDFAPKARFYIEFAGTIWACNVKVGSDRFRDRMYKSSGAQGVFSFVRAAKTLTQTVAAPTAYALPLEVDSVRYVKVGQIVDIYQAGTNTLLYTLTVSAVDKALDTVTFNAPDTLTFANTDINTTTDKITIPTAAWLTTGTPVTFWKGATLPAGLADGTVYYAIKLSSTTISLATTRANALAGTPIVDITTQGTGTHRITFSPVFGNKDEFWKTGRKGKLSRFWNTDYRNPEASDYIKLPATLDALNDITGVGVISNRMFPFTANAMFKFDGQTLLPLRNDVGCVAHRSIGYYDSFMAWLDGKGNIWIRNDEGGQQDIISEGIADTMALVPQSQLPEATCSSIDGLYKLYLGQIGGLTLRVVYNFRTNQWSVEWFAPKMLIQLEYIYGGVAHPHWFDEVGQMWVDEVGDDDNGAVIPMEAELGNDDLAVDEVKAFHGVKVYSKNSAGTKIFAQIDGGEFKEVGQIRRRVDSIPLRSNGQPLEKGTLINFRFTNSASGDPPQIDKMVVWFTPEEDTFRATKD